MLGVTCIFIKLYDCITDSKLKDKCANDEINRWGRLGDNWIGTTTKWQQQQRHDGWLQWRRERLYLPRRCYTSCVVSRQWKHWRMLETKSEIHQPVMIGKLEGKLKMQISPMKTEMLAAMQASWQMFLIVCSKFHLDYAARRWKMDGDLSKEYIYAVFSSHQWWYSSIT